MFLSSLLTLVPMHRHMGLGTADWEERRKGREWVVVSVSASVMVLEGIWEGIWGDSHLGCTNITDP